MEPKLKRWHVTYLDDELQERQVEVAAADRQAAEAYVTRSTYHLAAIESVDRLVDQRQYTGS